jgi:hypothetical protein
MYNIFIVDVTTRLTRIQVGIYAMWNTKYGGHNPSSFYGFRIFELEAHAHNYNCTICSISALVGGK